MVYVLNVMMVTNSWLIKHANLSNLHHLTMISILTVKLKIIQVYAPPAVAITP